MVDFFESYTNWNKHGHKSMLKIVYKSYCSGVNEVLHFKLFE